MPSVVLTNCKIMLGGYDLSGFHNSLNLEYAAEMLDDTVFGTSGTRSNKPGLKTVSFTGNGFVDFGEIEPGVSMDSAMFNRIGADREVMSFAQDGEDEGATSYSVRMVNANYNPLSGEVGVLLPFEFTGQSANSPLVRSKVLAYGPKLAAGNGTGVNLGAVLPAEIAYAALHVTDVGTNIAVTVESAPDGTFASPTTRFTFVTATGIGAQWMELVGPITDTWWRAVWTPTGGAATIWVVFGFL